jgi:hypothetical protein
MRNLTLPALALSALLSAQAVPAFAHGRAYGDGAYHHANAGNKCLKDKRTSRTVGGFIGALGGASAGRALAAAAVRPEGVILGSIVGAVVGATVGNANVDCAPSDVYAQSGGHGDGPQVGQRDPRNEWYQPSAQSYYGREFSGGYQAQAGYGADYADQGQTTYQTQRVVVTQTYQVDEPEYVYPDQYSQPQPYPGPAPQPPCSYRMCR